MGARWAPRVNAGECERALTAKVQAGRGKRALCVLLGRRGEVGEATSLLSTARRFRNHAGAP